jgi:FlaA1/EpsC-like NDP-sugar epimerase
VYDPADANVLKMPSFSLVDLAKAVIQEIAPLYGTDPKDISIRHIGKRAGEKMCEELMTDDEAEFATEIDDLYYRSKASERRKKHWPKIYVRRL